MEIRSPYNYDRDVTSLVTGLDCTQPTRTKQQFKEECDINTILKRFNATGNVPVSPVQPTYGDFTGIDDYKGALDQIIASEAEFAALPANLRKRFENDPAELLAFLDDANNRDEAIELGLIAQPIQQPDVILPLEPQPEHREGT